MDSSLKYFHFLKSKKIIFDIKAILFSLFFVVTLNYNSNAQENCGNGVDDDSDGLIDCFDPDCTGNPPPASFFNTANNGLGGVLPGGSQDLSWMVSSSFAGPYTPAYVMSSIPGVYYSSIWPNSNWISYNSNGFHSVSGGSVDYYFKISFLLPCFNPCGLRYSTNGTFCLTLDYFADNSIYEIWINGVPQSSIIGTIPVSNPYYYLGYASTGMLTASLCQNWQPGLNEIILRVSSAPNYIGLLVQSSINALPIPSATISGATTVCQNDPAPNIIFTGSGTAPFTFTYSINNGVNQTVISNGNTATVPAPTNVAGTFTYSLLSVQDANSIACPSSINNVSTITVNPIPLADAGSNLTLCVGTSTTLTATGGTSYQWVGGPASDVYTVSPLSSTTYTVTAYLNGCSASDVITVTIDPNAISTYNSSASVCYGTNYQLPGGNFVSSPGIYQDTLQSSLGCDSIIVTTLTVNPVLTQNVSVSICAGSDYQLPTGSTVNVSGVYHDTLFTSTGCDSIVITTLSVNPVYTQNISDSICHGDTYRLPSGSVVNNGGIYIDTISSTQGCDSIFVVNLSEFPQIQDSVTTIDISCFGGNDGEVQLFPLGGSAPFTFQLSGFGTNSNGTFNNLSAGNYSFTITDNNGCTVSGRCIVNQPNKIEIRVHPSDTTIYANDIADLAASCNYPNAKYTWSPSTFLSCDTCSNSTSSPDINITYHLVVSVSENGVTCSADTNINIRIMPNIFIPNAFTPNEDGLNDFFCVVGNNFENIDSFHIQIYNRWGQRICDYRDPDIQNFKWDGTFQGREEPIGVYVFKIQYRLKNKDCDEPMETGSVTIIR